MGFFFSFFFHTHAHTRLSRFAQTMHDGRIYTLNITCGAEYPDKVRREREREREENKRDGGRGVGLFFSRSLFLQARARALTHPLSTRPFFLQPPEVVFISKVNMGCVTPSGAVDPRAFPTLGAWRRAHTLERVLADLRAEMASPANRRLPQPPEGTTYQ